ncbi:MAG TPA: DUF4405 domain-containing protein [Candidatus Brocadiia bacterium]|nr:DUF4405 domain-containing protein [Candidatus Brocadiia bacterium]
MKISPRLNLLVDALMLLCMCFLAGVGLLLKHVLIPGRERIEVYGRNVELAFLGKGRHEWGEIHLAIGVVLLLLLALHIIMHWNMVATILRNSIRNAAARFVIVILLTTLSLVLLLFPLAVQPSSAGLDKEYGERNGEIHDGRGGAQHDPGQGGGRGGARRRNRASEH